MQPPHTVEDKEGGRCITAATAEPSGDWNALLEGDFHPLPDPKCLLQKRGGPNDEVGVVRGQHRRATGELYGPDIVGEKGQPIAQVEHLQNRLNGMIPIGSLAKYAQSEIHLGRCGELAWESLHAVARAAAIRACALSS